LSYAGGAALGSSKCHANYKVWNGGRFHPQNWFPRQRPFSDPKNNFRFFIYGQSPTKRANFVKIGPVNVEIIGLTEIIKNNSKNKPSSSEWAKNEIVRVFSTDRQKSKSIMCVYSVFMLKRVYLLLACTRTFIARRYASAVFAVVMYVFVRSPVFLFAKSRYRIKTTGQIELAFDASWLDARSLLHV